MDLNLHILSEPFPILIDLNLGGSDPMGGDFARGGWTPGGHYV